MKKLNLLLIISLLFIFNIVIAIERESEINNYPNSLSDTEFLDILKSDLSDLDREEVFDKLYSRAQTDTSILNNVGNEQIKSKFFAHFGITDEGALVDSIQDKKVTLKGQNENIGAIITNIEDKELLEGARVTEDGELVLKNGAKIGGEAKVESVNSVPSIEDGHLDLTQSEGGVIQIRGKTIISDNGVTYESNSAYDRIIVTKQDGTLIIDAHGIASNAIDNLEIDSADLDGHVILKYPGGDWSSKDISKGKLLPNNIEIIVDDKDIGNIQRIPITHDFFGNIVKGEPKGEVYTSTTPQPQPIVKGSTRFWTPRDTNGDGIINNQDRINFYYEESANELEIKENKFTDQRVANRAFELAEIDGVDLGNLITYKTEGLVETTETATIPLQPSRPIPRIEREARQAKPLPSKEPEPSEGISGGTIMLEKGETPSGKIGYAKAISEDTIYEINGVTCTGAQLNDRLGCKGYSFFNLPPGTEITFTKEEQEYSPEETVPTPDLDTASIPPPIPEPVVLESTLEDKKAQEEVNPTTGWIAPIENPEITSGFGLRYSPRDIIAAGMISRENTGLMQEEHYGTDIIPKGLLGRGPIGTPVSAVGEGVVTHVSKAEDDSIYSAYGNAMQLRHEIRDEMGNKRYYRTFYAHLQYPPELNVGDHVEQGENIGQVGSSGIVTGPHLHFEVCKEELGKCTPVDPETYLPKMEYLAKS